MTNSVDKEVEALQKILDDSPRFNNAAIDTIDQMSLASKYLSEKSILALSRPAYYPIIKENDSSGNEIVYTSANFAVKVPKTDIEIGVKEICNHINILAEKDLIHSALSKVSLTKAIDTAFEVPSVIVFCCVMVPAYQMSAISILPYFADGSVNNSLGDLRKILPEHQIGAEIRVSLAANMVSLFDSKEDPLQTQIDEYLRLLPKGTFHVSTTEVGPDFVSLHRTYEVIFSNPAFDDSLKKVELEHVRHCYTNELGMVKQINLISRIKYFDKDGNQVC